MQKERCLLGCLNQIKLSCRKVFIRHLRIFVSDGMVNEREKIRRSRITNFRDDRPLFDNSNNAFTLIELLVVVLIIGILAAVALPQYQKVVWKSRNAQLKSIIRSIVAAEDTYFMANGEYAGNFDELSIDLPLEAPVQQTSDSYVLENICSLAIMGGDSVRRGKNFQVVLNTTDKTSSMNVSALWTEGPYKCTGFSFGAINNQLKCIESRLGTITVPTGDFCERMERGTNRTTSGASWYIWDLP